MAARFTRNAIVLGLMSAVGPFAIDMYIPALPTIASDLHATTAATQMTLMGFFMSFGLCQIVYGPVSDARGRKPPLYVGLCLFFVASVGCGVAADVGWLIAWRVLQGAGASAVMVIPRAIIRDLHTGPDAARLMALVMLVFSVSPILAPLTGSGLIVLFGWRAVFAAVAVASLMSLAMLAGWLPETRLPADRVPITIRKVVGSFAVLFRDPTFMGLTFIGGFGMSSFFAFLASSSFVYIDHFGLTPTQYSACFALNAIGFIGASQFASALGTRFGLGRTVLAAVVVFAIFAVVLFGAVMAGADGLPMLVALLFCSFAALGLVIPTTMVLSLEAHGPIAGMASALGGTLQMVTGGVMIAVASAFFDGTPLPMVTIIALCAVAALALACVTLRSPALTAQEQPARTDAIG